MARTNYFVDGAAAGTGDGLSPVNAFVSITSVPFITVNTIDITAWVRKTHRESIPGATATSTYIGANWTFDDFPNWKGIIGWPNSGDPHYSDRPAAGVSASWDADVAIGVVGSLGGNVPTLVYSSAAGSALLGIGFFANLAIQNEGGAPLIGTNGTAGNGLAKYTRYMDNIWLLGPTASAGHTRFAPGSLQANVGKLTMAFSSAIGGDGFFNSDVNGPFDVRHMVIHSTTVTSGGIFPQITGTTALHIGLLQIDSNSINLWAGGATLRGPSAPAFAARMSIWVERVVGHKPYAAIPYGNVTGLLEMRFDDYYGEGPRLERAFDTLTRVASSGEAQHNAKAAVYTTTGSRNAAGSFSWMSFNDDNIRWPDIRKKFDVVSGTPLTINQPIYISSTAVYSLGLGHARGYINMLGGDAVYADMANNVIAGSYTNWTGSFIAGGSAWVAQFTFTPKETGTFEYEFSKGWMTESNSHMNLVGYMLIGEPEKV